MRPARARPCATCSGAKICSATHAERSQRYATALAATPPGNDGRMHPNRIFAALRSRVRDDAIGIADGGDFLSFARLGLATST